MTDRDDDTHDERSPREDDTGTEEPGLVARAKRTAVEVAEVVVDAFYEAV